MKLGDIADLLGSNIRAARGATELAERKPAAYSIDSRTIEEGALFFAIRGANHDGHHYVADAIGRRALAAVVSRDFIDSEFARQLDPQRAALLMVDDTLAALQSVAAAVLKSWQGKVVAVTGSLGKTTTKEMIAAMLSRVGRVVKTTGNLNNDFGVPLSVLKMESAGRHAADFDYAVLEMGMNHKGEIARLTRIAPPDVGIVTIVAPAHLEFFASLDEIAEAKSEMVSGIVAGGVAVLNADDERVARMAALRADITSVLFGIEREADVRAIGIDPRNLAGSRFVLVTPRGQIEAFVPFPGRHNLYNALAAAAVADHYGTPLQEIAAALAETQAPKMRGEVVRFRDGFTIIDDSYNSNPRALIEMVSTLCANASGSRRIVVAGEMLELGKEGARLHREAGREIARLGVDKLIGVRGLAREVVAGAREAGMSAAGAVFADSPEEAARILIRELRPGDLVLVKGSRGVKTEVVVESVKREFERVPKEKGSTASEHGEESLRQLA
ncbi:MAG TPA: UDP-N-acetylmuramoyl-tripeptide--D-alanyl-D-alanine ligase [Blastocatellia bacterium]|nr:UDP-N-acetylmuramoyl-tripeptide--D-alanyl-D-alanine ligase [Blastocatellia bacterium]